MALVWLAAAMEIYLVSNDRLKVFKAAVSNLAIPVLCGVAAWLLGQDTNWDLQNYHFYNAYAFLNDRHALDMAPAGMQTWLNPWLDVFWYQLQQTFPPPVAGFLLGFLHGLNFLLIYGIAQCALPVMRWHKTLAWGLGLAGVLSVGFRQTCHGAKQRPQGGYSNGALWRIVHAFSQV